MAHALGEYCLLNDFSPYDVEVFDYEDHGKFYKGAKPDLEMSTCVDGYVDFVEHLFKKCELTGIEASGEIIVNDTFKLAGTSDAYGYEEAPKTLHIVDYKHGMGIPVSAEKNKQLMCYALIMIHKLGLSPDTVALHVYQPREQTGLRDEPLDTWYVSKKELDIFFKSIVKVANQVEGGEISHDVGDYCRWCPNLSKCEEVYTEGERLGKLGDPKDFSTKDLAKALVLIRSLSTLSDTVKAEAVRRLETSQGVPGFKLVRGNGSRAWHDPVEAGEALVERIGEEAYTKTLLSVKQAEDKIGKKKIDELWVRYPGKARVAHESERGKSIAPSIEDVLNDLM